MKVLVNRWNCRHCLACGWSRDGPVPPHDKASGVSCRASGQRSERELRRMFQPSIPEVPDSRE